MNVSAYAARVFGSFGRPLLHKGLASPLEESPAPSLPEVHSSVRVRGTRPFGRFLAFLGPGYLVAVGYMDPGNWATSIAGGSAYGYRLLTVVLLSSLMAILLQSLSTRIGIGAGVDLAQACRLRYSKPASFGLWVLAEGAIVATDLAEVIGTAIGLNLLFDIPIQIGVVITAADVFLVLLLQSLGFRWVEAFVIALLLVIFGCFAALVWLADPEWGAVFSGFVPQSEVVSEPGMLYLALGIIGATVMPHNLYLHSAIVQTRQIGTSEAEKTEAIRFASFDSSIALMFALLVNASILIVAAATFNTTGNIEVMEIQDAHALIAPLLGAPLGATLFAVALLACGLNSAVTATLAGQIVMEGFLQIRLRPWLRRLVTRSIAIVPAVIAAFYFGESGIAKLLILSQVVLSLQLPFAIVPLVRIAADRRMMGRHAAPIWATVLASAITVVIIMLNIKLLVDVVLG